MSIAGIGGVFLFAKQPAVLAAWYRDVLGLTFDDASGAIYRAFPHRDVEDPETCWSTTWAILPAKDSPIGNAKINYRVTDLDAMVLRLRGLGVEVRGPEVYEYGSFASMADPDG